MKKTKWIVKFMHGTNTTDFVALTINAWSVRAISDTVILVDDNLIDVGDYILSITDDRDQWTMPPRAAAYSAAADE